MFPRAEVSFVNQTDISNEKRRQIMWPGRKKFKAHDADFTGHPETLEKVPHRTRFDLFHRTKEILGLKRPVAEEKHVRKETPKQTAAEKCRAGRPKVNLFPQISLNDVREKDLNSIVEYMYSSDWKEAALFTRTVSCRNIGKEREGLKQEDVVRDFPNRFRNKSQKIEPFDLPVSDVNLSHWYKTFS
ncbi:uncharacterized protein LOC129738426 [Uranotaenia lowii]|uniref:uncharacterized protein LOC129738426 n=1 Tax=Uranotaenia lowii TaxID=190385 RepID=UPI00247A8198|nr:uncharacterized protein LOC129738426 [Uranotaenia lowii]